MSKPDVTKADVFKGLEDAADLWVSLKEFKGVVDAHVENIGDRFAAVLDLERRLIEATSTAHFAGDVDVGEEVHLDFFLPITSTSVAASAFDVEAEAAALVAVHSRLREVGERGSDEVEDFGVGCRVGARSSSDRLLVDLDDLVDPLKAIDGVVCAGCERALWEDGAAGCGEEDAVDKR